MIPVPWKENVCENEWTSLLKQSFLISQIKKGRINTSVLIANSRESQFWLHKYHCKKKFHEKVFGINALLPV